ncbi:MAG TPA: aldehyde dehydrogenase (NADP(+)) [Taishania sp.]|nr:aldehyde dehydrogenase (NADP(+)) [Taishania sp.]
MTYLSKIGYSSAKETTNTFSTFNCLKNEPNCEIFAVATIQDAKNAIALAQQAVKTFSSLPEKVRFDFLNEIANELNNQRATLIEMYCKESSLSVARANTELDRTIFQLRNYGEYILKDDWNRPISSQPENVSFQIRTQLHAIGLVVVFGSSNFPFAYSTAGGDTASALAAGCPVIVKAHPMHAGTSYLVSECILKVAQEKGMPEGVFSHLFDDKYEIGTELVMNEGVKAVGFTGSIKGGRALMDLAAKREAPIPVFTEMGSVNPVVFFEEELIDNSTDWASRFTASISTDAGQFCTKPGILFIPNTDAGKNFFEVLQSNLQRTEAKCHLHPRLFENFKSQVSQSFDWIETNKPYHSQPTIRLVQQDQFISNKHYQEEFFGPQAIAVFYDSKKDLELLISQLKGQLTFTIIGKQAEIDSSQSIMQMAIERAGRIILNGVPTGVTVCDAMVHGGIYPAASDSRFTAVGTSSIYRFLRPVAVQTSF